MKQVAVGFVLTAAPVLACTRPVPDEVPVTHQDAPAVTAVNAGTDTTPREEPQTKPLKSASGSCPPMSIGPKSKNREWIPAGWSWGFSAFPLPNNAGQLRMSIVVRNHTGADATIRLPGSAGIPEFDYVIATRTGKTEWNARGSAESDLSGFGLRVPAKDSVIFSTSWKGNRNDGTRVQDGEYCAYGVFNPPTGGDSSIVSPPVSLKMRGGKITF